MNILSNENMKLKKPGMNEYMLCNSIYIKFQNQQNLSI